MLVALAPTTPAGAAFRWFDSSNGLPMTGPVSRLAGLRNGNVYAFCDVPFGVPPPRGSAVYAMKDGTWSRTLLSGDFVSSCGGPVADARTDSSLLVVTDEGIPSARDLLADPPFVDFGFGFVRGAPVAIARWSRDSCLYADVAGRLAISSRVQFQPGGYNLYDSTFSPQPPGLTSLLYVDRARRIWAGLGHAAVGAFPCPSAWSGLAEWTGGQWKLFTGLPPLVALLEDGDGVLWAVAGDGSLYDFDGQSWQPAYSIGLPLSAEPTADARSGVWLAADTVIVHAARGALQVFHASEAGWPSGSLRSLFADQTGQLWLGFADGRIGLWSDDRWSGTDAPAALATASAVQDQDGGDWFSGTDGDLYRFDGLRWDSFGTGRPIGADGAGTLWALAGGQVARWPGESLQPVPGIPPAGFDPYAVATPPGGDIWFCDRVGATAWRLAPGGAWSTFQRSVDFDTTTAAPDDSIDTSPAIFRRPFVADRAGGIWIATPHGASRWLDGAWTDFQVADSLRLGVTALYADPDGSVWAGFGSNFEIGAPAGIRVFRNGAWSRPFASSGEQYVYDFFRDREGALWAYGFWDLGVPMSQDIFGTGPCELIRYQGGQATSYDISAFDGPYGPDVAIWTYATLGPDSTVRIFRLGNGQVSYSHWVGPWFATQPLGAQAPSVAPCLVGRRDPLVFTAQNGPYGYLPPPTESSFRLYHPDETAPLTQFLFQPDALVNDAHPSVVVAGVSAAPSGFGFSFQLDDGAPTPFTFTSRWTAPALADPDGPHVIRAWARDALGNVDPKPVTARFTIDTHAPTLSLAAPAANEVVRGPLAVLGSVADAHPLEYRVFVRRHPSYAGQAVSWDLLASGQGLPKSDTLAVIHTQALTDSTGDGAYDLMLTGIDQVALQNSITTTFKVANTQVAATYVSPVSIEPDQAGEVYSASFDAHAGFPKDFFTSHVLVRLDQLSPDSLTALTPPGCSLLAAFRLDWGDVPVRAGKVGILDLRIPAALPADARPPADSLRVFRLPSDGSATAVGQGSTTGPEGVGAPVTAPGLYALGTGTAGTSVAGIRLALSPRVFQLPGGRGAAAFAQLAITLGLDAPSPVTVRIYNRAGRLVRTITRDERLAAGEHVLRWDGRDEDGAVARDGLHLLLVDVDGRRRTLPFAVVR